MNRQDGSPLVRHESETASDSTGSGAGRQGPHNPRRLCTGSGHLSGLRHLHEVTRLEDCVNCFAGLRRIIRCCVLTQSVLSLVVSLVLSRLDYGSTTLVGLPAYQIDRLQSVLNAAAWLVYSSRRYDHVTPLLRELHWLIVFEQSREK